MSKLPSISENSNSEILTMRISPKLKNNLNELAQRSTFNGTLSSAVRKLIEDEYLR